MTHRILITGSRSWTDEQTIRHALTVRYDATPQAVLVHGDCPRGADAIADLVWRNLGGRVETHPAKWDLYGKPAGHIRNDEMVQAGADECLAFILDGSPGASGCMRAAVKAGIPTLAWMRSTAARP